jgi:hypothetical protein
VLKETTCLLYKEDWDDAKKVIEAWWNRELDRPLLQLVSPKNKNAPNVDECAFLRHYPYPDKALDTVFQQFSGINFEMEAYPNVWVNLGPGSLSAYLGGELRFDGSINTSWFIGDFTLDELKQVSFDPDNKWWKYTCQTYNAATRICKNKAVVAFTDLLDAVTVTAQLRGNFPTNLIKDMFADGAKVKNVLERIHGLFYKYYEESCDLIDIKENGYSTWTSLWSRKKHFVIQCDFIVFLSPKMFREFILPLVVEECRYFDRTIWHLDGPLELKHLDALLSIEELDCIQWIAGQGNMDAGEDCWVPLYKKIKNAGKTLQLYVPPAKVMHILSKIESEGVTVHATCNTQQERDKLVKQLKLKYG